MAPAGNKAKSLLSVNHTTKTIHHQFIRLSQCQILSKYPLSLSIQVSFGIFRYQNLECPCLGNQLFYEGDKQSCKFVLVTNYEVWIVVDMIK